jgi:hypothetical protein
VSQPGMHRPIVFSFLETASLVQMPPTSYVATFLMLRNPGARNSGHDAIAAQGPQGYNDHVTLKKKLSKDNLCHRWKFVFVQNKKREESFCRNI